MRSHLRFLAMAAVMSPCLSAQTAQDFRQDFEMAIKEMGSTYAYFDKKATRWDDVPALYAADLQRVTNRNEFVALLEHVVDEIYDPHAQLTTNLDDSFRLVPSGTDLWAEWRSGRAVITQVRENSEAMHAGLRAGATVVAINDVPIAEAVSARLGRSYPSTTAEARDWALRSVLAGRHEKIRLLRIQEHGMTRAVELPPADQFKTAKTPLEAFEIRPRIGYIRINDSLGDSALLPALDQALARFQGTHGLILDLRNTASGGVSIVARGILGRFVEHELPYQKHVLPSEERDTGIRRSWLELATPREGIHYSKPVAVIVNRWTGSMGEGIAIGFDATRAATIVGTRMAGLLGATYHIELPRTGIGINLPAERLYHVAGQPREDYLPKVLIDVERTEPGADPFIEAAIKALALK